MQSCYYFDVLLYSPFKAYKRLLKRRSDIDAKYEQKRKVKEQYRQPFGSEYTKEYGRPLGWVFLMSAIEKAFFPVVLLIMLILNLWEVLAVTLLVETIFSLSVLAIITKGKRLEYVLKGLIISPLRYLAVLFDLITMVRFFADLWVFRNRSWRK
jgi:hypothetical protein